VQALPEPDLRLGEVARFCQLDLAPRGTVALPGELPAFEPRLADVGWVHGSLVEPAIEDEPDVPGPEVADLLAVPRTSSTTLPPRPWPRPGEADKRNEKRQGRRWWRRN